MSEENMSEEQQQKDTTTEARSAQHLNYINTVAALSIAPSGVGEELSEYVAQAVEVIRDSGLPNETNAMFTNIEGDLDDVLDVVRDATLQLANQGYRTGVVLKLDIRPGFKGQIHKKAELVDKILNK
ncbi:MTH1187 family thiamine-binding protein [Bifidobacterium aquikefiri]|uniref:thiamine-binding protein n=1 Tax=Bifidobacterium aquikefiri TaxID=1653207 RepID=UPI0023F4653D|nr:thiamine-binding protein [Bifidobacterium aquikefiri]